MGVFEGSESKRVLFLDLGDSILPDSTEESQVMYTLRNSTSFVKLACFKSTKNSYRKKESDCQCSDVFRKKSIHVKLNVVIPLLALKMRACVKKEMG
jgi:hypothetical protein